MAKSFLTPVWLSQQTEPATPNAGTIALWADTDGHLWQKDSTGAVIDLGAQSLDPATPIQMSKLPSTLGNRGGMNTRVFGAPLWTEGNTQYATYAGRNPFSSPTQTVTVQNQMTAGSGVTISLTRGSTPGEETTLVAVIAVVGATAASTVTPPANDGWELKGFSLNSSNVGVWAFEKVFTLFKGSVGPWEFARSDTTLAAEAVMLSFPKGSPASLAWDPAGTVTGTGTSVVFPSIATEKNNSVLVTAVAANGAVSVTTDASYTERTDVGTTAPSLSVATQVVATASTPTPATHTLSASSPFAGLVFAIPPITADDRPFITKRTLPDGAWDTPVELTSVASNTLAGSIDLDEHNIVTAAVGGDGRVYVAANMHTESGAARVIRTTATTGAISGSWEASAPPGMDGMTYPQFIKLANGDLLFFGRTGQAGNGAWKFSRLAGGLWDASATTLMDGTAIPVSPYIANVAQHPSDHNKISIFYNWRTSGSSADNERLTYVESVDGGITWQRGDGTAVTLPLLHPSDPGYTASREGDVIDTSTTIDNQNGCTRDTLGRPFIMYQKNNAGGANRAFIAYRSVSGTWSSRELPEFTASWSRGQLFAAQRGRVFAITTGGSRQKDELSITEVSPGVTHFNSVPLVRWSIGNGEPTLDFRDALVNRRLQLLVSSSVTMFHEEYQDDLQWNLQNGYVLLVPGDRLWEIHRGGFNPLGVELVGSYRLENPIRVNGKRPTTSNVGARVELDQSWSGSDLVVRLRCRGSASSDKGALLVGLIERIDPADATVSERARMVFKSTTDEGHETPWVPLIASGEGYLQLQASVQPTIPNLLTGPTFGDAGYGRITSATIEIGRVRV